MMAVVSNINSSSTMIAKPPGAVAGQGVCSLSVWVEVRIGRLSILVAI